MNRKRTVPVRIRCIEIAVMTVACLFLGGATSDAQVRLYTLECAEDYPSGVSDLPNSCDNTDGFDDVVEGFSGWARLFYWKESLAWPQDWMETNGSSGLDANWVDDPVDLSVWSGHGTSGSSEPNGSWSMSFGRSRNGTRFATSPDQIHLGEVGTDPFGGNGRNRFVIMDASCSAVEGEIGAVWINGNGQGGIMMRVHQAMAFHDSPDDSSDRLEDFADDVDDGDSNKESWLDNGESCFLFWCWNSPLIISFDSTGDGATNRHNNESLKNVLSRPASFSGSFIWNFVDNGGC